MTLEPLWHASLAIQLHVATVVPAAIAGAFLLASRNKGTPTHRLLGRIWLVLMVMTSASTFFIHELNVWAGLSPIHLLSVLTIAGCFQAYRMARNGRIKSHQRVVQQVYFGGIIIAGGFTLLPGRIMHRVVFDGGAAGVIVLLLLGLATFMLMWRTGTMRKTDRSHQ